MRAAIALQEPDRLLQHLFYFIANETKAVIYFILFYYEDRTTVHIHKKRLISTQKLDKTI